MKLSLVKAVLITMSLFVVNFSQIAHAGLLTGALNVDDRHWVYLSTDDNTQGNLLSSGSNWALTETFSTNLVAGTDYFLHIRGKNASNISGFLGEFNLTGSEHLFSNDLDKVLTNTSDWQVSTSGWNNYVNASMVQGTNGVGPWGNIAGVDSSATWIWSADAYNDEYAYFSLAITATDIPEPSALAIFALALMGLASRRAKKQV